jgi:predicted small lipoprotein YifL
MKRLTFLFSALAFMILLSGCGQSGPLYLPGDPSTIAAPPEEAVPPAVPPVGTGTGEDASLEEQESSEPTDAEL